jgi:hypothetical protein
MLKKYADRVKATYEYMAPQLILWMPITKNQTNAAKTKNSMRLKTPTLNGKLTPKSPNFHFGFEAGHKKIEVTNEIGCSMTGQTIQKDIRYLKEYKSVKEITIPKAYIIQRRFGILWIIKKQFCLRG